MPTSQSIDVDPRRRALSHGCVDRPDQMISAVCLSSAWTVGGYVYHVFGNERISTKLPSERKGTRRAEMKSKKFLPRCRRRGGLTILVSTASRSDYTLEQCQHPQEE